MIKAALEYVVGLKKPETVRHGGGVYADKPLYQMKKADFPTLKLNTLESIVRYVQKIGDERQSEDYEAAVPIIIHIESATCVALKDIANVGDGKRDCMVLATAEVPRFQYGEFHDAESFNIALQSNFLDTEDKATILQVVGNLKEDAVRTMTDDGVSQVTAVRTGVATVADVKVPNPVSLRPFRTFIEVDQPESRFIFRMREGGRCAIFEADGGAWKLEAKKNIYNYLAEQLEENINSGEVVLLV